MNHWLMKSEPDAFSIDDLASRPNQIEPWNGVRNYQVRNLFRDRFAIGDLAFFYHSSCPEPGIYGVMDVVSTAYPDPSQFDPGSDYHDPKSTPAEPRWLLVDVRFQRKLRRPVLLATLRENETRLQGLLVLAKGTRLSVTPVSAEHWQIILQLAGEH